MKLSLVQLQVIKAFCAAGAAAGTCWVASAFLGAPPRPPELLVTVVCAGAAVLIAFSLFVLDPAIARARTRKGAS